MNREEMTEGLCELLEYAPEDIELLEHGYRIKARGDRSYFYSFEDVEYMIHNYRKLQGKEVTKDE